MAIAGQFKSTFQNCNSFILIYWRLSESDDVFEQLIVAGAAGGIWAYGRHRQRTNVHLLALNLTSGIPFTPKEKATMIEILTPPPQGILSSSPWWKQWLPR